MARQQITSFLNCQSVPHRNAIPRVLSDLPLTSKAGEKKFSMR